MANKIKCTYPDCFKHFATAEAMRKHKAKDDIHEYYCKRCDFDCDDDTLLFLHQITSPKHICCPVCCREFKSQGGRDRHVEIDHVPKQKMNCAGCNLEFQSASSLMFHIENNDCETIKNYHFHRQRSEKQIMKDALEAAQDPTAGTTILSNTAANPTSRAELTLLDDERAWVNTDWQGNPVHDPDDEQNGPYVGAIEKEMSELSVNSFPPLGSQPQDQSIPGKTKAWSNRSYTSNMFTSETNKWATENTSINLLDQDDLSKLNDSVATWGTRQSYAPAHSLKQDTVHIDQTRLHANPHTHIKSVAQVSMPSYINVDKFWDPISENYSCPGQKCGQRFNSIEDFKTHLIADPVHVGGTVSCPSCLKRFKTTAALIAHCESGSRKCKIRHAIDYDVVIRDITAGLIAVDGYLDDGGIKYTAQRIEDW